MGLVVWLFAVVAIGQGSSAMGEGHSAEEKKPEMVKKGEMVKITPAHKIHGFGPGYDPDIYSPKSVVFSKDGSKFYVNSLEGCKTVVYDSRTYEKLKVIDHSFKSGTGELWIEPSVWYHFMHYPDGRERAFRGKPVEGTLSKDGKYLFVSYYRRTFDINAQEPSAVAVIDTDTDEIIRMIETGPLPKMVKISNDGTLLAITHWGDNTVGLVDISDSNPERWRYLSSIVIGKKLDLDFSTETPVNRDANSGFLLRGTAFLPGDSVLLVGGMAGPLAVIDVKNRKWLGSFNSLYGVRHLAVKGDRIFMTRNSAGELVTVPVDSIAQAVREGRFNTAGIERVKVGSGARTLQVSPSGRFAFIACNFSSEIVVVDTREKKVIATIEADPYPVGLDLSPEGTMLVSTSQGRNGIGGNAVNIFDIEYTLPEISLESEEIVAETLPAEDTASADPEEVQGQKGEAGEGFVYTDLIIPLVLAVTVLAILLVVMAAVKIRRRRR